MEEKNGFKLKRRPSTGDLTTNSLVNMFNRLTINDPLAAYRQQEQTGRPQTSAAQTQDRNYRSPTPYPLHRIPHSENLNEPGPSSRNGCPAYKKRRSSRKDYKEVSKE